MDVQTPYLDAIQAIPGATPGEKYKWIGMLIKERISECKSLEEMVESEKIPRPLVPLVQVHTAKMLIQKDPLNTDNYGAIAEALKSDDATIVRKALQAHCFFDRSNKTITNVSYFFDHLFPYVSLNTRIRIIKHLAIFLTPKEPFLAEQFFLAVATTYGLEQALPLLPACSETFMYNTILERRIVLSRRLVNTIFRRNPDFIVRYFKLSKTSDDPSTRNLLNVNISNFGDILAALIKKRLKSFVELYEMHETFLPPVTLSNKCAEAFLKNGKEHLQRKPKLYIKLVPLKLINATCMEAIYSKLFPKKIKNFSTDHMLNYLEYYPQDKKVDLFMKSYREVYNRNVLHDWQNVTAKLMRLLPAEERIRQARIKIEQKDTAYGIMDYTHTWRCYLPVDESIPVIKEEISKTSEMEYRAALLCQMIYCCRVNNDDQALLEVLTYLRDRHKNEQAWFLLKVFESLLNFYDLPQVNEDLWTVLMDIIVRAHVKNDLLPLNCISVRILEAAIHFKIIHNQSIDQLIRMLVDIKSFRYTSHWNILEKYPEYERMCLEACLAVVSQSYDSDSTPWNEDKVGLLYDLSVSIYNFNEAHVNRNTRIERMSVKNYPWLLKGIEKIMLTKDQSNLYMLESFRHLLEKHEKDLYERLCEDKKKGIADVASGEALALLKKDPENILLKWKEYLRACEDNWNNGGTKRFVRATRWYKEIPVRFVEQCLEDLTKEKKGVSLNILALLVHGETLRKIIEPLIPANKTIDIHHEEAKVNYNLIRYIITSSKIANPPVSLKLVRRFCEGDYLSMALIVLNSVCRRTSVRDVVEFAKLLVQERVSVRKHGIRLFHMVAPREQLYEFLLLQWEIEKHHSIREILSAKVCELFQKEPGPATWSMLTKMVSTFTTDDEPAIRGLIQIVSSTPNEYVVDLIKLLLKTIDNNAANKESCYTSLLDTFDPAICNLLPEEFIKEVLRRFLFQSEQSISESATMFVLTSYLLPAKDKLDSRMKIFFDVFVEIVKKGWDAAHPECSYFYPTNYALHKFVYDLINRVLYLDVDPRVIDGILKAYLSVLTPHMEPTSYLLLVFAKELLSVKTPTEFGVKLAQKLPELVETFSPLLLFFMSKNLQYLLRSNAFKDYDNKEIHLGVIKGLMEIGSVEAALLAVTLLPSLKCKEYKSSYEKLVATFKEHDHPAIKSILSDVVNSSSM